MEPTAPVNNRILSFHRAVSLDPAISPFYRRGCYLAWSVSRDTYVSFTIFLRTCGFPWLAAVILACTSYPEGGRRLRYTYAHRNCVENTCRAIAKKLKMLIEGGRWYLPAVDGSNLKAVEPRF